MSRSRVKGPAGDLTVEDQGKGGLPVVFVHSFAGSSSHWAAQLDHLRQGRRAIAFDLRAHGESAPSARGDYAVRSFADDIAAVVDALGLERFVLVGHSLGGAAGIAYAGTHPDRVAGLLLVGAPGRMPEAQSRPIISAMEQDYAKTMAGYWERLLANARPQVRAKLEGERESLPQGTALAIIKETFAFDPLPDLAKYEGPKLSVTTTDMPHELHNLVPDLAHEVVTGTSHWVHMDRPDDFNRTLDEFLAEIDERKQSGAPDQAPAEARGR